MVKLTLEKLIGEITENPDPHDNIEMILEPLPDQFIDPKLDDDEDDLTESEKEIKKYMRNKEKKRSEEYSTKAREFIESPEGKKAMDYVIEQRLKIIYSGIYSTDYWKTQKGSMSDSTKSYRKRFKKKVVEDFEQLKPENLYEYLHDIWYFFILTEEDRENFIQKANRERDFYKEKYEALYQSKKWEFLDDIQNNNLKRLYAVNEDKFRKYEFYRREFNRYKNLVIQMEYDRMEQKARWSQYGNGGNGSKDQDDLVDELLKKKKKEKKRAKKKAAQKKHEKFMKDLDTSSDESDSD